MFLVKLYRAVPPAYQRWALRGFAFIVILGYTALVTALALRLDPARLLATAALIALVQWMLVTASWEVIFHSHPAQVRGHRFGFCVTALAVVTAGFVLAGAAYYAGQISAAAAVSVLFAVTCVAHLLREDMEQRVLPLACPAQV